MKFVIILSLLMSGIVFAQENIQDIVASPSDVISEDLNAQPEANVKEDVQSEDDTAFQEAPTAALAESTEIEEEIEDPSVEEAPVAEEELPAASDVMPAVTYEQDPTKTVKRGSEVVNLSATIVGNQEQPTVLYIVPWKAAEDTTILYLPLSSKAMEHIFGHVERVEHQRQVQYIDQLDKQ
ncbi:MAG: hypothetical protein K6L80_10540 [Agarilytica sp.]